MNFAATAPFAFSSNETREIISLPPARQRGQSSGGVQRAAFCVGAYRMKGGRLVEVLVGQKSSRGLRYVGSARPAMTRLRDSLYHILRMLRVHTFCPFVGILARSPRRRGVLPEHAVAECQWVEANVKVWVEFDGWTEDGQLVNPRVIELN